MSASKGHVCLHKDPNCGVCGKGRDFQVCAMEKGTEEIHISYHETLESAQTSYGNAVANKRFGLVQLRTRKDGKWTVHASNQLTRQMLDGIS